MEIIEQVRQVSSIVEIAGQYTALRKRGRKWVGLCPFHSEKDPSFTVDEEKQLYHCFGCGAGGDIYSLVMEKENLNFPEALRYLAEKYHIPLPQQQKVSPEVLKLEEKLFKTNDMALAFYRRNLFQTQEGKTALAYLEKRGLSEETIQKLKVGYAPNSWNALLNHFRTKSVPASLLEKGGLVLPGQKSGEFYDRFRGRVIFPIFSLTGKVVAFGGRTVVNADPKYLNSPDTPLYSKGKLLYGLNFSKDAVREAGEAILVEGYTDYAALFQAGFLNVVASLGTALTPFQVTQALRFAPRIIINYDGDDAGRAAAARAVPICLEKGLYVQVLVLPNGLDPDAYIRKQGRDRYLAHLKRTVPGLKFLVDSYAKGARLDAPEEKARVARAVMNDIEKVPDAVARSEYLKQTSEILSLGEDVLRSVIGRRPAEQEGEDRHGFSPAEKRLLQILMEDRGVAPYIFAEADEEIFRGLRSEPVFQYILECFRHDREWSLHELKEKVQPALVTQLSRALVEGSSKASVEDAQECLKSLRKLHLQNRLKELQAEIVRLERKGEREKLLTLLYQKQDVTKQILSL
ncbi:MAG: DNA primase [Candidatus Aminicenantes bacterium]|nr:DNA primase [Candidatus Aminicenantes bacterium]